MGVARWKWAEISARASEFIEKYGLSGQQQQQEDLETTTSTEESE